MVSAIKWKKYVHISQQLKNFEYRGKKSNIVHPYNYVDGRKHECGHG